MRCEQNCLRSAPPTPQGASTLPRPLCQESRPLHVSHTCMRNLQTRRWQWRGSKRFCVGLRHRQEEHRVKNFCPHQLPTCLEIALDLSHRSFFGRARREYCSELMICGFGLLEPAFSCKTSYSSPTPLVACSFGAIEPQWSILISKIWENVEIIFLSQ